MISIGWTLEASQTVGVRSRSADVAARVAVNLVALAIVAFMVWIAGRYYATRLPPGDMARNMSIVLRAGELADTAGFRTAFRFAANEDIYVLHSLVSVLLHPVLPQSFASGPALNAIWYLIAINVLFTVFLRDTGSAASAVWLALPPAIFMPAMSTTRYGFTGLDANLLAYLLACAVFGAVILSDGLADRRWAAAAGALFGCLVLGRLQSSVIVAVAIAPFLAAPLLTPSRRRIGALGLAVFTGAALVVCGGWLAAGLRKHWTYYSSIATAPGQSFEASYGGGLRVLGHALDVWFRSNVATGLCWVLLSWIAAREIFSAEPSRALLRRVDWARLWLFVGPLAALAAARPSQEVYAFPAYVGLYLFATKPFRASPLGSVFGNRRYMMLFAAAVSVALASFLANTISAHASDPGVNRQEARALLQPIVDDSRCRVPHSEIRVTVTYYTGLTDHNVVNSLLVDAKQPSVQADRPPHLEVEQARCVVNVLLDTYMGPPPLWGKIDSTVTARRAARLLQSTDYATVLTPGDPANYTDHPSARYHPQWLDLSRRLLESGCWTAVGPPRTIMPVESATLLRRTCR